MFRLNNFTKAFIRLNTRYYSTSTTTITSQQIIDSTQTTGFNTIPLDASRNTILQTRGIHNPNSFFSNLSTTIASTTSSTSNELTLVGETVELIPLKREHAQDLVEASKDGELSSLKFTVVPNQGSIGKYLDTAFAGKEQGTIIPFTIVRKSDGKVVGSTRFWKLDRVNRNVEIGHTWLSASVQRSSMNTECKLLLLTYAFEVLNCIRVQFTTDELNEKSAAAILRLGAKYEGTVRHERIMPDGRKRNSLRFSIIDSEWEDSKSILLSKLSR
ncbi:hypothetical protein CYY_004545 [Polysphondylium violaceum]|uniref:N-acetyltransferase domain-containing protein n=1 Tax=Polysphondylium violaceum TaxID=133409 RepID=A0A8J4PWF2_9MYCE|nr:hypothetical protein CYY_004545 [Polysphondylium violaceum]